MLKNYYVVTTNDCQYYLAYLTNGDRQICVVYDNTMQILRVSTYDIPIGSDIDVKLISNILDNFITFGTKDIVKSMIQELTPEEFCFLCK